MRRRDFFFALAGMAAQFVLSLRSDSGRLQRAIDACAARGETFHLHGGTYRLTRPLVLRGKVHITDCYFHGTPVGGVALYRNIS